MNSRILFAIVFLFAAATASAGTLALNVQSDFLNTCTQGGVVAATGPFTFTPDMERQLVFTLHRPPLDDLPVICRGWRESWACKRLLSDMRLVMVECHLETDAATGAVEVIADRIHFEP